MCVLGVGGALSGPLQEDSTEGALARGQKDHRHVTPHGPWHIGEGSSSALTLVPKQSRAERRGLFYFLSIRSLFSNRPTHIVIRNFSCVHFRHILGQTLVCIFALGI